ncbi:response regulator transcription factor [Cuneatibacter caecimuris]|uniref:Stage 0 sporulation protein A homolog n=1 Tax=Cuneatibacter caecimuris TaxID=1796618 RepID=A0A4Q7NZ29_9FIRM|nr:response regulator transcription factor [Cuneatibacter caecimuris]RZS92703.1 DNA-binding response OmpR family regulator [Cuneatibacter caecimuris]
MLLLIIEDDRDLAASMKKGLEKYGFYVDVSNLGAEGEEKAYVNEYDVILLDLNLPDKDGIEILQFLRESGIETPVLIISARDEIEERALGLDLGADDYITKPFQLLELRARIQAVVRRFHGRTNPVITIGELSINPATRTAAANGVPILLAPKEFDILEYLAQKHPAVTTAEEVAEHIYDENFDPSSSILRVHFSRLKRKLADGCGREILQNIRGKGYWLCEKQS